MGNSSASQNAVLTCITIFVLMATGAIIGGVVDAATVNPSGISVNAWIALFEDQPSGTNYNSSNSAYQTLIQNNVYQSVDMLFMMTVETVPTGPNTIPSGNGNSYTIQIQNGSHNGGLTNQDYMNYMIYDARRNNPNIKIAVTLDYYSTVISSIFSISTYSNQQNANNFAANVMAYLQHYNLDGFDIDWESPNGYGTTQNQFGLFINAIGAQFQQQTKKYYLTLSTDGTYNLDSNAVNTYVDFINLEMYSSVQNNLNLMQNYKGANVNANLLAYGVLFQNLTSSCCAIGPPAQVNASQAYQNNRNSYNCSTFTSWCLITENYQYEQAQQQQLYQLCNPSVCGGCYGASTSCCNTCASVVAAYQTRGWVYNINSFYQCTEYCGSCYGAAYSCCGTCTEVIAAYTARNWAYNQNSFYQCTDQPYCGGCYGASSNCCNTCVAVIAAYQALGWSYNINSFAQCTGNQ